MSDSSQSTILYEFMFWIDDISNMLSKNIDMLSRYSSMLPKCNGEI